MEVLSAVSNIHEKTPLELIDKWDFIIVLLSVAVRFFIVIRKKAVEVHLKGKSFKIGLYLDQRHIIRWFGHTFTALVLLLFLPEIFDTFIGPKYFSELGAWSFTCDFILGFLGYDIVKLLEGATIPFIRKRLKIDI